MSGDEGSGGEGSYDLNAFVDWGASTMFSVLPVLVRRRTLKARRCRRTKHHLIQLMHTIVPPPRGIGKRRDYPKLGRIFRRNTLRKTFQPEIEEDETEEDETVEAPPVADPEMRRTRRWRT